MRFLLDPYYLVLLVAIISVSTAGAVLRHLDTTPPILKAFWRTFYTTLVLGAGFAVQWHTAAARRVRSEYLSRRTWAILLVSGSALGLHFGTWIWSLDHTSLAHSLLFVTMHPIVIVLYLAVRGTPINRYEVLGVLVSFAGVAVMLADVSSDTEVTFMGDLAAFVGAVMMVVYMFAGKELRKWVPLTLYAFPVTLVASLVLLVASLSAEDVSVTSTHAHGMFAFFAPEFVARMTFVVLVPGVLGHTGINAVLERLPPLTVSIALTTEPVFGTLFGMAIGDSTPGVFTALGGPVCMIGTMTAVYGTYIREKSSSASTETVEKEDGRVDGAHDDEQVELVSGSARASGSSELQLRDENHALAEAL